MLSLNYRQYGSGPPLVILHGLFGSADNWHSLARRWASFFTVYALDLRNHGASPHDSLMSYAAMVQDLERFMDTHAVPKASILGHSMGGKVAMLFASTHSQRVTGLVVLDMGVSRTQGRHVPILQVLEELLPEEFSDRDALAAELKRRITATDIRQFLLKNLLRRVDSSFTWKFNREVLQASYDSLTAELELDQPYLGPTLFLRGEHSDYLEREMGPELLRSFPMAQLQSIKNAGHWLHAEQPDQIFTRVLDFLQPALGMGA